MSGDTCAARIIFCLGSAPYLDKTYSRCDVRRSSQIDFIPLWRCILALLLTYPRKDGLWEVARIERKIISRKRKWGEETLFKSIVGVLLPLAGTCPSLLSCRPTKAYFIGMYKGIQVECSVNASQWHICIVNGLEVR